MRRAERQGHRTAVRCALVIPLAAVLCLVGTRPGAAAATAHRGLKPIVGGRAGAGTQLTLHSSAKTGVVSPTPRVYLVFWGSQWSAADPHGAAPALQQFFGGLYGSADTWGTILDQYCEGLVVRTATCGAKGTHVQHPSQSVLAGTWFDAASAEPRNATTTQLAAEALRAARHFGNTAQGPNLNAQYVIASASGVQPDGFPRSGFCGWHDVTQAGAVRIAYTNLPYVPDTGAGGCTTLRPAQPLDGYFSTETHEYAETVTDLFPSDGWLAAGGNEIGDLCINVDARLTLSTGSFDVQGLWSNAARRCVTHG